MTKKIPVVRKISKDKIISTLRKELKRKDDEIERLKEEKELLFQVSIKNAKKRLEED